MSSGLANRGLIFGASQGIWAIWCLDVIGRSVACWGLVSTLVPQRRVGVSGLARTM